MNSTSSEKEKVEREVRCIRFTKDDFKRNVSKKIKGDKYLLWYKEDEEQEGYVVSRLNGISTIGFDVDTLRSEIHATKMNTLTLRKDFISERALNVLRDELSDTLKFSLCAALYVSATHMSRHVLSRVMRDEEINSSSSSSSSFIFSVWTKSNGESGTFRKWRENHDEWARGWIEHVAQDIVCLPKAHVQTLRKFPARDVEFDGRTFIETLRKDCGTKVLLPEILSALLVTILVDGAYDARASMSWRKLATHSLRDETQRVRLEHGIEAQFLYLLNCGLKMTQSENCKTKDVKNSSSSSSSWGRYILIGGGAVVGGGLVAFTGGLAIPALATGLGYFGASIPVSAGVGSGIGAISTFLMSSSGIVTLFFLRSFSLAHSRHVRTQVQVLQQ